MNYVDEWKRIAEGLDDPDLPRAVDADGEWTVINVQLPAPQPTNAPHPIWGFITAACIGFIVFTVLGAIT